MCGVYSVQRREVRTIKNYHGYPGYGTEVRWYVLRDGEYVEYTHDGYIQPGGIYFTRKRDAVAEVNVLQSQEESSF